MPTKRESRFYTSVERWMKRHFLCFKTAVNKGLKYGRVDVIGVKDIGGDLSGDVETIAVEVKKGTCAFPAASGQTLGYNVFANRVYLADVRAGAFTSEELQIASHLGIGLIQIRGMKCLEVLSSPFYTPIQRLNLGLLENLGLARCQLCSSFFQTGNSENLYANVIREDAYRAIQKEKGLVFWNYEAAGRKEKLGRGLAGYGRRFVCPDCVANLLAVQPNRRKGWFSEYIRGSEFARNVLRVVLRKRARA
jgi:hypothetical protein